MLEEANAAATAVAAAPVHIDIEHWHGTAAISDAWKPVKPPPKTIRQVYRSLRDGLANLIGTYFSVAAHRCDPPAGSHPSPPPPNPDTTGGSHAWPRLPRGSPPHPARDRRIVPALTPSSSHPRFPPHTANRPKRALPLWERHQVQAVLRTVAFTRGARSLSFLSPTSLGGFPCLSGSWPGFSCARTPSPHPAAARPSTA